MDLYNTYTDPMATKAFLHFASHSLTNGGDSQASGHPACQEQLGLGVLLMEFTTLGQVEPGIETPTF